MTYQKQTFIDYPNEGYTILKAEHLKVLAKYGFAQVPPHEHFGDTPKICRLWYEGLKFLGNLLKQKGIVYAT
jgi:hypothetical protein